MPSCSTKHKQSDEKNAAAQHVLQKYIKPNMRIGLGLGSTAEEFIKALAKATEKQPQLRTANSRKNLVLKKKLGAPSVEDKKNASLLEKTAAAKHALQKYIKPNMRIALGSGSTAEEFIKALAKATEKRPEMCIASSRKSLALAKELGLPIAEDKELVERNSSAENPIEMIIDGADEIDSKLRLIKGGGGCLLREKILAQSCAKMIVIAEKNKVKKQLGAFPLPVEIEPFAWQLTRRKVVSLFENVMQRKGSAVIRGGSEKPELTDGGNMTLDCAWGEWKPKDVATLAKELDKIPGVLENGIFEHEASTCVLASYKQGKVTITEINKKSPLANIKRNLEQRWMENSIKLQQGLKTLSLATKRRLAFLQAVVKERQL